MRPYDVRSENDNLSMTSDNHPQDAERWSILNFADKVSLHPPADTDWVGWIEIPRDQFNAIVDWYMKDQAPPATDLLVGRPDLRWLSDLSYEELETVVSLLTQQQLETLRGFLRTSSPPGSQIRTAECDGKDAVPVTGQLPVGTASTADQAGTDANLWHFWNEKARVQAVEIDRLRAIEVAAAAYVGSVNGGPGPNAYDEKWQEYDAQKQQAFDDLCAALSAEVEG